MKVSIWSGQFHSMNDFDKFIEEKFDEDGDCSSAFMESFEIEYIDPDLQENAFLDKKLTKNDFSKASYAEQFIDKLDESLLTGNSIIILYDFEYSGKIKTKNNVNFIGAYDYEK